MGCSDLGVGKMAQQGEALAAKPADLNSSSGTYMVGEIWLLTFLCVPHPPQIKVITLAVDKLPHVPFL